MKWNNVKPIVINWFFNIIFVLAVIAIICLCIYTFTKDNRETTPPVEKNKIDSLTTENIKITIEVEHLDSIKNAKIIEVKNLDNDSTLKLFYKLISE